MDPKTIRSQINEVDKIDKCEGTNGGELKALSSDTASLMQEVRQMCSRLSLRDRNAAELNTLLNNPHLEALLEAHDNVAAKDFDDVDLEESYEMEVLSSDSSCSPVSAIRIVCLRKSDNEPLGMTVCVEDDIVVIARILAGGLIDKQKLLNVGDAIIEVNGQEVHTPEQLQEQIRKSKGSVTFKVSPAARDAQPAVRKCYMRALFTYDPMEDTLLPCREIGLPFKQGDVLEILNQDDLNWWQARLVDCSSGNPGSKLFTKLFILIACFNLHNWSLLLQFKS